MVNYWVWMRCQSYRTALRGFPDSIWGVMGEQAWRSAWLKSCEDCGASFSWAGQSICVCMFVYVSTLYIITLNIQVQENCTNAVPCFFQNYFVVCQNETLLRKSWKICSISWVNLYLADLALCQLIWTERGAASAKNAFDSLFIYLNWSAVIKSSVSHYSLLEKSGALPFAKIFEWLGPRHGPCQSDGKHSLCLLDSLKCCCKSSLPVQAARSRL